MDITNKKLQAIVNFLKKFFPCLNKDKHEENYQQCATAGDSTIFEDYEEFLQTRKISNLEIPKDVSPEDEDIQEPEEGMKKVGITLYATEEPVSPILASGGPSRIQSPPPQPKGLYGFNFSCSQSSKKNRSTTKNF